MMRILLSFFIVCALQASNLLTYNIYERTDRVDIMLSFDAPYEGKIYQKKDGQNRILTFEELYFDQSVQRTIQSSIIQALSIESSDNTTVVTLNGNEPFNVVASKTVDGFGLRIRARLDTPIQTEHPTQTKTTPSVAPPTFEQQKSADTALFDSRYWSVLIVLALMLLLLVWIKKRLNSSSSPLALGWSKKPANGVKILFQKPLDAQNKVVLLEYGSSQYLVLTGTSNTLLERFGSNKVQDENEFKALFEQNRQKLDEYLRLQQSQLNDYKEKASKDFIPS